MPRRCQNAAPSPVHHSAGDIVRPLHFRNCRRKRPSGRKVVHRQAEEPMCAGWCEIHPNTRSCTKGLDCDGRGRQTRDKAPADSFDASVRPVPDQERLAKTYDPRHGQGRWPDLPEALFDVFAVSQDIDDVAPKRGSRQTPPPHDSDSDRRPWPGFCLDPRQHYCRCR